MRSIWGLLAIPLVVSCSLLEGAKGLNERYYTHAELQTIEAALSKSEPSFTIPKTLYMTDDKGSYYARLKALSDYSKSDERLAIHIAFLMGDGERVVSLSSDTTMLANGYLLMGNGSEARRLMGMCQSPDPPTLALVALNEGDTLGCINALDKVLSNNPTRVVGTRVARLWVLLDDENEVPHRYLATQSLSPWERYLHLCILGEAKPTNKEEEAWATFVQAKRYKDPQQLRDATDRLLSFAPSGWRDYALQQLLPILYDNELWVETKNALIALPKEYRQMLPYRLLLSYSEEIDLLELYEKGNKSTSFTSKVQVNDEDSFWQRWGDVENEDNWAMERSRFIPLHTLYTKAPTKKEYNAIRQRLSDTLKGLSSSTNIH